MSDYVNYKKDGIPMTPKNPHHKECVFVDDWSECHKECPVLKICAYYIPIGETE